ncbi:FAD-dependent oxidoreductase [Anaerotruncus massiliensis (ex Liu et al. 2021)]|uniref:FAD-dependent oxidoreductase n=2 Tax=Anaerotruncus TaxID=244127 RepID=A0A498CNU1_9FIRM|nr:FAD-dependent oxidoreductase [Anaerotruncus massiliensis (ex Liu et al. 2021)]MBC3938434.1 FAD-dependent oxidoreductase [Anaerotruncus massiliensis (ex Togo et al. 2019)]RLL12489.1 FAD-dependent oxidoreductase [Anaerotruncus massiliensis (ex Liu et al. 2021)]
MSESIWSKAAGLPERPALAGGLDVDAAVIGGGMAGVLTAHFLKAAGLRTVLLEASRVGGGQTKNTTAKITSQHGLIYHRLIERSGEEPARQYADANQRAVAEYRRMVRELGIDCDFTEAPAYLYSTAEREPLAREFEAAKALGIGAAYGSQTELPFPVAAALRFDGQARFHPLRFLRAVAGPLEIYEGTPVRSVEGNRIFTDRGEVTAAKIVLACHYPFLNAPGYYFMRMHQERSYVLALKNASKLTGMYLGVDADGLSFRPQGDLLLLGGGNHRTGENSAGGQYQRLREAAKTYWPESAEAAAWSAQDCMTLDGVPYIGRYSASTPDWYVATGFQKWGMTSSMVSALLITGLITEGKSPWEQVFTPQRFNPSASARTLMRDTAQAAKGLARKFLTPPREDIEALPRGHGGVVEYDGEKVGVYKDENGEAFIVSVRCPHLGCQLEWNPDEKSWDCPCHGSRFDFRGRLIDNPAQEGLEGE